MPAKRFEDVRLGELAPVPGHSRHFHVVTTPRPIAVLSNNRKPLLLDEAEEKVVADLARADFPIVAWIGPEAVGAAVVHGYSALEDIAEEVACAAWALKSIGGWDESPLMTISITHAGKISWFTVQGEHGPAGWSVDVTPTRSGKWQAVGEEVARIGECAVIFADVDWAMPFNDAYGHSEGDLMLARVCTCIEIAAFHARATVVRVEGDGFAVVVPGTLAHAVGVAEQIRRDVEAMNIPFSHVALPKQERVTISAAAALPHSDLRNTLEEAVYGAKCAGRNTVVRAPQT